MPVDKRKFAQKPPKKLAIQAPERLMLKFAHEKITTFLENKAVS
jgi:hypothetical protein